MGDASNDFRVMVVGSGCAGLLTAQALQKQGIRCTVFEQDATFAARSRDWNFGIYWAQVPVGECLPQELGDLILSCQVDSWIPSAEDYMPIYNVKDSELMKKVPVPYNIRLQRRNFLKLISRGVDIRYGKRLSHVESDGSLATAVFEDGTREQGNLLIGADGAHSQVRTFLCGSEKAALQMSPLVASATTATLPAETALQFKTLHPRYVVSFHPDGYFAWIGIHEGYDDQKPGEWKFMVILSWIDEQSSDLKGPEILKDMKERSCVFGEPFKSIFQSIPDDTKCWHNRLTSWITEPWDNRRGTVTLVGDAAHPMTFHRGQGLNNAIHDAASLAGALGEHGVKSQAAVQSALAAYEREMWPRGKEAVQQSTANSLLTHNWSTLLSSPLFTMGMKAKVDSKDG